MKKHTPSILTGAVIALLVSLFVANTSVLAAPMVGVPVQVTQPDGTTLDCFASGDEYYNWLHDAEGYTIIQDHSTGYYVYANLVDGKLVPTGYIPGRVDPADAGLAPYLNPPAETIEELVGPARSAVMEKLRAFAAPTNGTITNLVVFIRFAGESEFTTPTTTYSNMLNSLVPGYNSLRNYFLEVSYNAVTVNSNLYPIPGITILSYQDTHARNYFQPYDASTNPDGYSDYSQRTTREHTLLQNAITSINNLGQFPGGLTIDANSDGYVDSVTFVIYGSPTGWNSLLWPHAWSLYSADVRIAGKRVYSYNLQLQSSLGTGVLAHEVFHVMGSPDLYHYYSGGSPVGSWDVMDTNSNPPEHMSCYMKYKYGHWINSLPELSTPGIYSLSPLISPTNNCFKIDSPNSATEFFIVEYRVDAGPFESSLPGTGMLIYRINPSYYGNASGPPDEVYLYRPGGTPTSNGTVYMANYSSVVGRTGINDTTAPSSFLTDGSAGGLDICSIGAPGTTISFFLGSCSWVNPPSSFAKSSPTNTLTGQPINLTLDWGDPGDATYFEYCIDATLNGSCNSNWYFTNTISQAPVSGLIWNKTYEWQVRAVNSKGTTFADTSTYFQFSTLSVIFSRLIHMPLILR